MVDFNYFSWLHVAIWKRIFMAMRDLYQGSFLTVQSINTSQRFTPYWMRSIPRAAFTNRVRMRLTTWKWRFRVIFIFVLTQTGRVGSALLWGGVRRQLLRPMTRFQADPWPVSPVPNKVLAIKVNFSTVTIRLLITSRVLTLINAVLILHPDNPITNAMLINLSSDPIRIIQTLPYVQIKINFDFGLLHQIRQLKWAKLLPFLFRIWQQVWRGLVEHRLQFRRKSKFINCVIIFKEEIVGLRVFGIVKSLPKLILLLKLSLLRILRRQSRLIFAIFLPEGTLDASGTRFLSLRVPIRVKIRFVNRLFNLRSFENTRLKLLLLQIGWRFILRKSYAPKFELLDKSLVVWGLRKWILVILTDFPIFVPQISKVINESFEHSAVSVDEDFVTLDLSEFMPIRKHHAQLGPRNRVQKLLSRHDVRFTTNIQSYDFILDASYLLDDFHLLFPFLAIV